MPRSKRLALAGIPLYITQRGVNHTAIFLDDGDRRYYLELLARALADFELTLHAYVLMDNHVHLLIGAQRTGCISQALRLAGQSYVQTFNLRHARVGTLWQGRFKSCLVDSQGYALRVMRYIELNPVRAALVGRPDEHPWSSVRTHLGQTHDPMITLHPAYLALAADPASRASAYRAWLHAPIDPDEVARIRDYIAQEKALGDRRFQAMVAKTLDRPADLRPRGRPPRTPGVTLAGD
jgi:putative transposase